MSDELLERFIRDYIAAQAGDAVSFAWHGGETPCCARATSTAA